MEKSCRRCRTSLLWWRKWRKGTREGLKGPIGKIGGRLPMAVPEFSAVIVSGSKELKIFNRITLTFGNERKMQKPLTELLKEYDFPVGIFPRDATNYEFNEETRKLTVYIPSICEVGYKDSSVLRFATTVTGYLEKGKLADIEGMKTKVMIWVKVTAISSEKSKLHFSAGMKKTRNRDAYEVNRSAVNVDKF
nr:DUF538 domain-containing protein [Ipomoea batatas]